MKKLNKLTTEELESLKKRYKKANADYRSTIAKQYGFTNVTNFYSRLFGAVIINKAKESKKAGKTTTKEVIRPTDYVIAFDTTGSMSRYIGEVRKYITGLIPDLFSNIPDLKVKIVAFGDYCDMFSATNLGNAYQDSGLINDQNELITFVKNAKNTGGGDSDEFYELVINKVTEETPWRENSIRTFLLIGDCNPHSIGYSYGSFVTNNQIDWRKEIDKATDKNIKIDTLACGSYYLDFYKEVSKVTEGVHAPFTKSQGLSEVVKMSAYSRSSKTAFTSMSKTVMASGDSELKATYTAYSKEII